MGELGSSKILPGLLPGVQSLLTIDLIEMTLILRKGIRKFELTKRCRMIPRPFQRMRVGDLSATTWKEGNIF